MSTTIIIFASKDDPDSGLQRARLLRDVLKTELSGVDVRVIDKRGFDLEELHLVARHQIVSTPTVLILEGKKAIGRLRWLPAPSELKEMLT